MKINGFRNHVNQIRFAFLLQRFVQNRQIFLLLLRYVVDVVQVGIEGGFFAEPTEYQGYDDQRPKSKQLDFAPSFRRSRTVVNEEFVGFSRHDGKQRQENHHEQDGSD